MDQYYPGMSSAHSLLFQQPEGGIIHETNNIAGQTGVWIPPRFEHHEYTTRTGGVPVFQPTLTGLLPDEIARSRISGYLPNNETTCSSISPDNVRAFGTEYPNTNVLIEDKDIVCGRNGKKFHKRATYLAKMYEREWKSGDDKTKCLIREGIQKQLEGEGRRFWSAHRGKFKLAKHDQKRSYLRTLLTKTYPTEEETPARGIMPPHETRPPNETFPHNEMMAHNGAMPHHVTMVPRGPMPPHGMMPSHGTTMPRGPTPLHGTMAHCETMPATAGTMTSNTMRPSYETMPVQGMMLAQGRTPAQGMIPAQGLVPVQVRMPSQGMTAAHGLVPSHETMMPHGPTPLHGTMVACRVRVRVRVRNGRQ